MESSESLEVTRQRIARDPRVVDYLSLAMGGGFFDLETEIRLAEELSTE